MIDFDLYFKRQIELWGRDTQKSLQKKRVLLIGAGGLGCSVGFGIGASGVGEIDIVDFDRVSISNIHRQIAFELEDEGEFKAKVLAKKIKKKSPFVEVRAFEVGFEEFIKSAKREYDLIIDATDNLQTRAKIDKWAKSQNTPWIYGAVEEFNGQVCFFENSNFDTFANKTHTPKGIAAPMVMQIASFEANLALRFLANLPIKKDTLFFIYYNSFGEFKIQEFKMPKKEEK